MTYRDATPSQKILNISVTQAKPIEEPDRLADDFRRGTGGACMCSPTEFSKLHQLTWQYPMQDYPD